MIFDSRAENQYERISLFLDETILIAGASLEVQVSSAILDTPTYISDILYQVG